MLDSTHKSDFDAYYAMHASNIFTLLKKRLLIGVSNNKAINK